MVKLGNLIGQKLKWVQPHTFKLEYELHAADEVVATLQYPHFFDTFATAACADGIWTFKGGDFKQPIVSIRVAGAETGLAVFKNNVWTASGILELPDGRKYRGNSADRGWRYEIKTMTGEPVVSYQHMFGILHMSAKTSLHSHAKDLVEIPWIIMLGWHMTLIL
jgi:hypothetical protein